MVDLAKGKFESTLAHLREEIVEGAYKPGVRLPPQSEICNKFGVGSSTVQRVYQTLVEERFIRIGARKSGTYVVERPPHLHNYALVIPAGEHWSRWYGAIHQANDMFPDDAVRFNEYATSPDARYHKDVERLCHDVDNRLVGGVIFAASFAGMEGTSVLTQKNVPCVRGHSLPKSDIPAVCMDMLESFINRAVEYLTSKGCRRIAHLYVANPNRPLSEIMSWLRDTGIEVKSYWVHSIYPHCTDETTANVVNVLMHLKGDDRPDALLIHDDNLIDHAVAGLLAAGVKVPEELEVVAHFNYPAVSSAVLPMKRLGFDGRVFLRKCVEVIEMQRRGDTPPPVTYVPALFEDELETEPSGLLQGAGL